MGTKKKTKSSSHDKTTPVGWAQSGLQGIGDRIGAAVNAPPLPMYQGDFIAQPGAMQQGIPQQMLSDADFVRAQTGQAMQAAQAGLQHPVLSNFSEYDPTAIQPVIQAAIQPAMRQLQEQVLPTLQSSGIESGAYGGTRSQALLPSMAIGNTMRDVNELGMGLAYQDWNQQQQNSLAGYNAESNRLSMYPELLSNVLRTRTGATDVQATAAAYDQQLRQQQIDNARQQYQNQLMYPYQGLDVAAGILGPLAQPYASHDSRSKTVEKSGGLGQVLQGAMGLAGMVAPMFLGPAGAAMGGMAGAGSTMATSSPSAWGGMGRGGTISSLWH